MGGKRKTIAKGIYADKSGVGIVVSVRGTPREFRYELVQDANGRTVKGRSYKTFTKAELLIERKRVDAREHLKGEIARAKGESLRADVQRYAATLHGRTRTDAETLLSYWTDIFGDRHRHDLTAVELRQHAATWTCAASTFNHRRQALVSLYKTLDGPQGPNPAREIPKRQERQGAPRALSYDVIRTVLSTLPASDEKAWLTLLAYTGLPHTQMKALTEADWQGQRLRVTPRRKGAGAAGRWIPLAPEAIEALSYIKQHQRWGRLDRYKVYRAWRDAGPKGSNPYSLRHSWITELYRRSNGDVLALQQLALHARLDQTQRYAAAALEERMRALVLPRNVATTTPENRSTSGTSLPPTTRSRRRTVQGRNRRKARKRA